MDEIDQLSETNRQSIVRKSSCVLQCGRFCNEATDSITSIERWENMKKKALLWRDLDRFGNVHAAVDWEKGPVGQYVHNTCRLTLWNAKKLKQSKERQKKREADEY